MRQRTALLLAFAAFALPGLVQAANHNVSVGPGNNFSPANVSISVGDTVIWTRLGGTHNVRADDDSFGNAASSSWTTFSHTFSGAGSFEYYCEVHSAANSNAMNGTVVVTGGGGNAGTLQFSTASTSVNENAGTRVITVTRTGGDNGPVSVNYETVNGSATFANDYTQTNGTLNWADNDDNNKTFAVPITNDSVEEPAQSFVVRLTSPGGGATLGGNDEITVTINDDDTPTGGPVSIRFTSATAYRDHEPCATTKIGRAHV